MAESFSSATVIVPILAFLMVMSCSLGSHSSNGVRPQASLDKRASEGDPHVPLYFLLLLPTPSDREDAGWDVGPSILAGARVARDEVHKKAGLLEGYRLEFIESGHEACGIRQQSQGVANFVYNMVNSAAASDDRDQQPVVAVGGLMCSDITDRISSIAGRPEIAFLQLSGADSPIFDQRRVTHPYLWQFIISASALKNVLLSFMDKFSWNKTLVVYDGGNLYYTGIAAAFRQAIAEDQYKRIVVEDIILAKEDVYYDQFLKDVKASRVRVIFTITSPQQSAKLACIAKQEGLTYPNYQWVYTDDFLFMKLADIDCPEEQMLMGAENALVAYFRLQQEPSTHLFSGSTYEEYTKMYNLELENIESEDGTSYDPDLLHGGIAYDQVWALAIALNTSIPLLKEMGMSIENYTYGEPNITAILQQELAKVNFTGASTNVFFTETRELFNKINIYHVKQLIVNSIGTYDGNTLEINLTGELVDDVWDPPPNVLDESLTALLFTLNFLVVIIVTVVLFFFIVLRKKPAVKATSPLLSCLLFIGCYILCFAALCNIVRIGFELEELWYTILCNLSFICVINGILLIFITILVRLLRIHKIFNNKHLSSLHVWAWSTWFLSIVVIVLCTIPIVILVVWLSVDPIHYNTSVILDMEDGLLTGQRLTVCTGSHIQVWIALFLVLAALIAVGILFLSIQTRKIQYKNFKDTKKVNMFLASLIVVSTLTLTIGFILRSVGAYFAAMDIAVTVGLMLFLPILCQVFLFIPKIVPEKLSQTVLKNVTSYNLLRKTSTTSYSTT